MSSKSQNRRTLDQNNYSVEIERANVITHGIGVVLGIFAFPSLFFRAQNSDPSILIGVGIYCLAFILLFFSSTLYHLTSEKKRKQIFKKLDHMSIYIMIAGTYTPFIVIYDWNKGGIILLASMWGFTAIGIVFKIFTAGKFKFFSTLMYVLMGVSILFVSKGFFSLLPTSVFFLIISGGVLYLSGVFFYLNKRLKYHHPIWHLFVLGGAICHWIAVYASL